MKSYIVAYFLVFLTVFSPTAALAASGPQDTNRYYVQTTKTFWRNALGARNVFDDGFTADLTDLQLRFVKFAGLKPLMVKRFSILATEEIIEPSSTPTPQTTPAAVIPWGVRYLLGYENINTMVGGKGVSIAVIDTGVDRAHPDVADRVAKCADYADPAEAFIDDECEDTNGHGTHMAGIIAADGGSEGKGIWGLAPQADLLVYRACNTDGLCFSDDIAKAIMGAVDEGANILVLGFGGESNSSFVEDAISYAVDHDVLVVAAAGNDGPYDDSMDWPARNPLVVSVGALDSEGAVADFSSRGDIEFVAPGVNIESTFRDDGYAILSGTSMAASHVAALAARIWQTKAEHPAAATRLLLHDLAKDVEPAGDDQASGRGVPTF